MARPSYSVVEVYYANYKEYLSTLTFDSFFLSLFFLFLINSKKKRRKKQKE